MLRQRSVLRIATIADDEFTFHIGSRASQTVTRPERFQDLLFEHEFPLSIRKYMKNAHPERGGIKALLIVVWDQWLDQGWEGTERTVADRERWFLRLAEALIAGLEHPRRTSAAVTLRVTYEEFKNSLGLDGYEFADGRLRRLEENVFDVPEQAGAIEALWSKLGLGKLDQLRHDLKLADEHYEASRWGDCILHARSVLETTLHQIAVERSARGLPALPAGAEKRPFVIRDHLCTTGFLDTDDLKLIVAVYGLVSRKGGHPNIAPHESARILRQHAFTAVHFLLLRFEALHPPPV
jgi:hypothetical protein